MVNSRTTGEMVDGKKHGNWITYYPSGMKRNEGNYAHGKKDGLWIHYHKNGNVESKASFRDGKYEGECITYHPNGNLRSCGVYPEHIGKSYDGKKEGAWYNYEEDGETVWLIVTYKKGGSRAKPDEYPLGVCHVCGEGRRLSWDGSCPKCGEEVEKIPNVSESRDIKGGAKNMTNEEIAQKLLELHTILLVADYPEDHATRYPRLAYTISRMEESVAELVAEGRLQDEIPGVGDIVSTIITEYVQTGTCSKLEEYAADVPETIVELIPVPGLGAKTIKRFYQELGIDSLASLKQAIDENRFKGFRGVGKKTLENLKAYIDENME